MLDELSRAHRRVFQSLDMPPAPIIIGHCEGTNEDGTLCGGRIVADLEPVDPDEPGGKKQPVNARCRKCRGKFDAQEIMNANVSRAHGHWTTLNEAAQLVRTIPGMPSRATIYRMAERGEFEQQGTKESPLYSPAQIANKIQEIRATT